MVTIGVTGSWQGRYLSTNLHPLCLLLLNYQFFLLSLKKLNSIERPPPVGEASDNLFADRGRLVVSSTDPYGRILGFSDWIKLQICTKNKTQERLNGQKLLTGFEDSQGLGTYWYVVAAIRRLVSQFLLL
jgi:hypothetical protein